MSPPRAWRGAFLLLLAGLLAYAPSLSVPFYLDDWSRIVENPLLRDVGAAILGIHKPRGGSYLSFALNYAATGLSLPGFHLANLVFHVATGILVYLCLGTVAGISTRTAFFGACLFLLHPLQTQAVTYLVQRMTVQSGMFMFAAIFLYLRAGTGLRSSRPAEYRVDALLYAAALVCAMLAISSKENAILTPIGILAFQRLRSVSASNHPDDSRVYHRYTFLSVVPFFAVSLAAAFFWHGHALLGGATFLSLTQTEAVFDQMDISPGLYLMTEFSVFWHYVRLLLVPFPQQLLYDTPIAGSYWELKSWLALGALAAMLAAGVFLRRRMPLVSFGIFWFPLMLTVESTLIPLDPVFEHRLYVPMFGFVALVCGATQRIRKISVRRVAWVVALTSCFSATAARNMQWREPVSFYEENLLRAPRSPRVYEELTRLYLDSGDTERALSLLASAEARFAPTEILFVCLADAHAASGKITQAAEYAEKGLLQYPDSIPLRLAKANILIQAGRYDEAGDLAKGILQDNAHSYGAYLVAASSAMGSGKPDEAVRQLTALLEYVPEHADAYYNLGVIYYGQERFVEARTAFDRARGVEPTHVRAVFNSAVTALMLGDTEGARGILPVLQRLNKREAASLERQIESAERYYRRTQRKRPITAPR